MDSPPDNTLYKKTFFPYASAATERVRGLGGRFAYYTTAATAVQILRNREIWMRNTLVMNDFMEVDHGLNCLIEGYRSQVGQELDAALNACFPEIAQEIKDLFNAWIPGFRRDTFVTCLSEHTTEEDAHGRLSMWRAYGGTAGVALVFNGDVIFRESDALAAYCSPVGYLDALGVTSELKAVAARIQTNQQYVKTLGRQGLKDSIFHMLRFAAVCTKHPAFREEREWRVVASPAIQASDLLSSSTEVVGGVPQTVLKIKLEDHVDRGLYGLTPTALIERVLVGPCEHPDVICRAMRHVMQEAGVEELEKKVVDTGIPLRPNQR